jgi:hypothetical protein
MFYTISLPALWEACYNSNFTEVYINFQKYVIR